MLPLFSPNYRNFNPHFCRNASLSEPGASIRHDGPGCVMHRWGGNRSSQILSKDRIDQTADWDTEHLMLSRSAHLLLSFAIWEMWLMSSTPSTSGWHLNFKLELFTQLWDGLRNSATDNSDKERSSDLCFILFAQQSHGRVFDRHPNFIQRSFSTLKYEEGKLRAVSHVPTSN